MSDAYSQMLDWVRDVHRLEAVEMLLEWDQETMMPPSMGARRRGRR